MGWVLLESGLLKRWENSRSRFASLGQFFLCVLLWEIGGVMTLQKTPGVMDFLSLHFVGKWGIEWCVVCGFECIFLFFVFGGGGPTWFVGFRPYEVHRSSL